MLQRIQTYYLGIIIIIQIIAISGMDFITYKTISHTHHLNAWGLVKESGDDVKNSIVPVFIGFILIALLAFLCIRSYKNLDRQLKLGRTLFYIYLLFAIGVYFVAIFADGFIVGQIESREMGLAYWVFICGLPFSFLANTGIKRDKRLLDSLKRL